MPKITITEELAKQLFYGEYEGTDYEYVEEEDWRDDGKYSYQEVIFKHNGKFYSFEVQRCGIYHTDYDYTYYTDCTEVVKKEIVTEAWVAVE